MGKPGGQVNKLPRRLLRPSSSFPAKEHLKRIHSITNGPPTSTCCLLMQCSIISPHRGGRCPLKCHHHGVELHRVCKTHPADPDTSRATTALIQLRATSLYTHNENLVSCNQAIRPHISGMGSKLGCSTPNWSGKLRLGSSCGHLGPPGHSRSCGPTQSHYCQGML